MGKLGHSGKLFAEFLGFARAYKAYWILPIGIILGLAALVLVTTEVVAPLIYTMF